MATKSDFCGLPTRPPGKQVPDSCCAAASSLIQTEDTKLLHLYKEQAGQLRAPHLPRATSSAAEALDAVARLQMNGSLV